MLEIELKDVMSKYKIRKNEIIIELLEFDMGDSDILNFSLYFMLRRMIFEIGFFFLL